MYRPYFAVLLLVWPLSPQRAYGADVSIGRSFTPVAQATARQTAPDIGGSARQVVSLTNEFRRQANRGDVKVDPHLREAAGYFADYIARNGKLDHEADGNTPAVRARRFGYDYCIVAENLAYDYRSDGFSAEELARSIVDGWKHSPGHRKNMLEPDVTDIGVAIAPDRTKAGAYYAVQMFGRPKSAATHFQIANRSSAPVRYEIAGKSWTLPPRQTRTHEGCSLGELRVELPGKAASTQISNGDRYAIVPSDAGAVTLKKE